MGPIWQAQLGALIHCPIGNQIWGPLGKEDLTLPWPLINLCSAIRVTLGQRQIRQSPGLALNANPGNDWDMVTIIFRQW